MSYRRVLVTFLVTAGLLGLLALKAFCTEGGLNDADHAIFLGFLLTSSPFLLSSKRSCCCRG